MADRAQSLEPFHVHRCPNCGNESHHFDAFEGRPLPSCTLSPEYRCVTCESGVQRLSAETQQQRAKKLRANAKRLAYNRAHEEKEPSSRVARTQGRSCSNERNDCGAATGTCTAGGAETLGEEERKERVVAP